MSELELGGYERQTIDELLEEVALEEWLEDHRLARSALENGLPIDPNGNGW